MHKLKFKKAKAENFLCFGPEGIIIDFEKYGNIVLIQGKNLDVKNSNSSNGAGKSSLPELPVYALFGKTIKKPKKLGHSDVINYKTGKKLMVEFQWDDYRVVRTREPNSLRLWKSEEGKWNKSTEITLGGMPATQKLIEEIIGLNYDTFVNLYIFSDDPSMSFLECDGPAKRSIVENLLSLEKYRNYSDNAKIYVRDTKDKIKNLTKDYERILVELESCQNRLDKIDSQEKEWQLEKEHELKKIFEEIKKKRDKLEASDNGAALAQWHEAQEQIGDLRKSIPEAEDRIEKINNLLSEAAPKLLKVTKLYHELNEKITKQNEIIKSCNKVISENKIILKGIQDKTGKDCPYCLGMVDESKFSHMISRAEETIAEEEEKLESINRVYKELNSEFEKTKTSKSKIENGITSLHEKLRDANVNLTEMHETIAELSRVREPDVTSDEQRIQGQIEDLKQRAQSKKNEESPYLKIKISSQEELEVKTKEVAAKREELTSTEAELPYYEFWVKAFGESGIRKYVIDGIIPALNNRVDYWLQFLIDNKIKLKFDNQLNEKIDRYPFMGRPYVYHGMSGGQRRRLNLTVSQSFAHILMLNCGACPSAVWLDEVTMNMDPIGVEGIYRMICELSKDKQVFVIDHNENLLRLLDGCDTINIEMYEEITKIVD